MKNTSLEHTFMEPWNIQLPWNKSIGYASMEHMHMEHTPIEHASMGNIHETYFFRTWIHRTHLQNLLVEHTPSGHTSIGHISTEHASTGTWAQLDQCLGHEWSRMAQVFYVRQKLGIDTLKFEKWEML